MGEGPKRGVGGVSTHWPEAQDHPPLRVAPAYLPH